MYLKCSFFLCAETITVSLFSVTHWRIGPADPENVRLSRRQQPSQPPPSSPPNGQSPSTVLLSVYWSLSHMLQSVKVLAQQFVNLSPWLVQCVQYQLHNEFICQWNWSQLWISRSKVETSCFSPLIFLCCNHLFSQQGVVYLPLWILSIQLMASGRPSGICCQFSRISVATIQQL